ncbi:MAG: hypothetical protein RLO49_07385, partial [Rhodospirillales bacterium]
AMEVDGDLLEDGEREEITALLSATEAAIAGQDRDAINNAVEKLEEGTRSFAEKRMDRGIRAALRGVDVDRLDKAAHERDGQPRDFGHAHKSADVGD